MLFLKTNNTDNDNAELSAFGAVHNLSFDKFKPHLQNAINKYLLPAIGAETYAVIESHYTQSSSVSASSGTTTLNDDLLVILQRAEFNCGMALLVKVGQYQVGNSGVSKIQAQDYPLC